MNKYLDSAAKMLDTVDELAELSEGALTARKAAYAAQADVNVAYAQAAALIAIALELNTISQSMLAESLKHGD